ncbi:MAG: FG-GAP-like repeat-containing protein [Phycisphaerales bacterium]|nr:FG-GAP-like repeat-containing protein [Phycisphaerales bacterium]
MGSMIRSRGLLVPGALMLNAKRVLMSAAGCGVVAALLLLVGCQGDSPGRNADVKLDAAAIATHNGAVAAMGAFDYERAFSMLEPLVQDRPQWLDGQVDLSIAQLNRQQEGDEEAALARVDAVIKADPSNLRAQYVAGVLRSVLDTPARALKHFRIVAEADPDDAWAAYYTGRTLTQTGRPEEALVWFERAIERNPYLRSSYYGGAQAARRTGNDEKAHEWLTLFARMEHNPRATLAEIKYTRMGPKATLEAIEVDDAPLPARPEGPIFDHEKLSFVGSTNGPQYTGISVARVGDETFVLASHPLGCSLSLIDDEVYLQPVGSQLSLVQLVTGGLWGDVDADGYVDVVLLRNGVNELWRGGEGHTFTRDEAFLGGPDAGTVDGALYDADHDGDLDALFLQLDGSLVLINNDGDGSWRDISPETFASPGDGVIAREVLVADFDGDLDADILCLSASGPNRGFVNDRLWKWQAAPPSWDALLQAEVACAVAADIDADGEVEVVTQGEDFSVDVFDSGIDGWASRQLAAPTEARDRHDLPAQMAVVDLTGDGLLDVVRERGPRPVGEDEWSAVHPKSIEVLSNTGESLQVQGVLDVWTLLLRTPGSGPGLITADSLGTIVTIPPGSGRFPFVEVSLVGRTDPGQSMRSNASGIGATLAARVGSRWTITDALRSTAGPGQSLQPISIGLGGAQIVDFIAVNWSDGVYQTEASISPPGVHEIVETQRQLSSCPVLFGWDGETMAFLTDCLGVGGIGFLLEPGRHAQPRPQERVLLPDGVLKPRDGRMQLVIAEPMQETCYLDDVSLLAVDCPEGWEVLPDERMGTGGPAPSGDLLFAKHSMSPTQVLGDGDRDLTMATAALDELEAAPGAVDDRFLGRSVDPFTMHAYFDQPLDAHEGTPLLVIEGWVEYPYSQTMFAAWQAGVTYDPLTVSVQMSGGLWVEVAQKVGYPAGMPRTMVLPLTGLPEGARHIGLHTTLDLHVDRLRVAWATECPEARVTTLEPLVADLTRVGYPRRQDGPQRRPGYVWDDRMPFLDMRTQAGLYTRLGDVRELVGRRDGALAVFGAGEAIELIFEQPEQAQGTTRRWILDLGGWAKDVDLMTDTGSTVDPLPGERDARAQELVESTRTRYRDGV